MLVERHTTIHAVGNIALAHGFFQHTRLGIGAIKDGEIGPIFLLAQPQFSNLAGHHISLFHIAHGAHHLDKIAFFTLGENFLFDAVFIIGYQAIGNIDDVLCGSIVSLQFKELALGISRLKLENILDIGTTERVDALRIVAHHTDTVMFGRQHLHNQVLRHVGILVLVHQNKLEMLLPTFQHLGTLLKQRVGIEQDIIEVEGFGRATTVDVLGIDLGNAGQMAVPVALLKIGRVEIVFGRYQCILGIGNARSHGGELVDFLIELHFLDDGFEQAFGIGRVVDAEIGRVAESGGFHTQNAQEQRVESAHPQARGRTGIHQFGHTFFHFTRCLVGKGQGQNVPGSHALTQ